jgi:hypothetical protein
MCWVILKVFLTEPSGPIKKVIERLPEREYASMTYVERSVGEEVM